MNKQSMTQRNLLLRMPGGIKAIGVFMLLPLAVILYSKNVGMSADELVLLNPYKTEYQVTNTLDRIKSNPAQPENGFSFSVWGDCRSNLHVFERLWYEMQKEDIGFSILLGDMVKGGTSGNWSKYFFPVIDKYRNIPLLPVIGNHDLGNGSAEYDYLFGLHEYCFDYGEARFIAVDNLGGLSNNDLAWLENELAAAPGKYRFVFAHIPPATIEKWSHHSFSWGAEEFSKLMTKYNVTAVFMGHIHAFSTATFDGVEYIVTGGGGAPRSSRFGPEGKIHHYCVVHVAPQSVSYEVAKLDVDGTMVRQPEVVLCGESNLEIAANSNVSAIYQ